MPLARLARTRQHYACALCGLSTLDPYVQHLERTPDGARVVCSDVRSELPFRAARLEELEVMRAHETAQP